MSETNPAPRAAQSWPVIMNNKTVRKYLDCPSPYYWRLMKALLLEGGYEGFKNRNTFHLKTEIDAALGIGVTSTMDALKKQMMEAAKNHD